MTVEVPKWLQSKNIIKVDDRKHDLRPGSMLIGLKASASDGEKENFEKEMNRLVTKVAKIVFPEMKDPYYKWTGEVVDKARMDDDDEDNAGGGSHGNTKIPFGLCQREGIKVQPGWTPQDAWNALEGKGYNAKEAYKELRETGKVSSKAPSFKYERPAAQDKALKSIIRKTARLKKEQSRIVDADGNILAESKGDHGSVGMKVGVKREHLTGNVIIHNHPGGGTFSSDDLDDFGFGAIETVVACEDGTYSLVNSKFNTKERYDGWREMRDALEDAMENSPDFEEYRLPEYKLRNMVMDEQKKSGKYDRLKQVSTELLRMHDEEGADLQNPTGKVKEMLDEYNRIEEQLAKERKAEVRRRIVKPFDDFYKENAEKYGFVYTFTPAKKRKKDARADAADADSYRARREQRLRDRYGENYDAIMAFRARRSSRLDAKVIQLDDENWKTINGTHVEIGEGGQITKGPERLRNLSKSKGGSGAGKEPEKKKRPLADIQKDYDDNKSELERAIKRKEKAKKDFEMSSDMQSYLDDPGMPDDFKEKIKQDFEKTQAKYKEALKEVDGLIKKDVALKKELDEGRDEGRKADENAIRTGVTSYVRDEKVVKAIAGGENMIRNQSYESGVCVDKNGNKIFEASDGAKSQIDLTKYANKGLLKDVVFTHNHPNGTTFSEEDISTAVSQGMAEIRACHKNGAYSLVRQYALDGEKPENHRSFAWDYYQAYTKYKENVVDAIWRKGPQVQETADKCNGMIADYRRNWLRDNSKKYGWIYTEETK